MNWHIHCHCFTQKSDFAHLILSQSFNFNIQLEKAYFFQVSNLIEHLFVVVVVGAI